MVNYEAFYPGIDYMSAMPSYYTAPSTYQVSAGELGTTLDAQTANQLGELNTKINPGAKVVEIQGVQAVAWESIPDQHLDEMNRLNKLTGVEPSLHGPLLDASGVGEGGFTEENRFGTQNQMESVMLRAHKLDPTGNISVTFHSTVQLPEMRPHIMAEVDGKRGKVEQGLFYVNEDTGQIGQIKPEKRYFPEGKEFSGEEYKFVAETELNRQNEEFWSQSLGRANYHADFGENSVRRIIDEGVDIPKIMAINADYVVDKKEKEHIEDVQRNVTHGQIYLRDAYRDVKQLFDRAWGATDPSRYRGEELTSEKLKKLKSDREKLKNYAKEIEKKITPGIESEPERTEDLREIIHLGIKTLSDVEAPKIFRPLNNFAIDKSAETFANVAESAYNKFGDTAPIVNIENPPAGTGLSTGEDIKDLIVASREKLANNLSKKMSRGKANRVAEQMIGATWDVGHINMLRKKGYTEKEVIEETKKVAPYVKHVHLSDNFGLDHTELPMGMGNVPFEPMLKELEKAGYRGKKIIEAGNWWQYFSQHGGGNPFKPSLEAFDSPIYAMKEGPAWANTGLYGGYFSGHGAVNPPVHHNIYGAGFQTLPLELGGEMQGGEKGRFAGS